MSGSLPNVEDIKKFPRIYGDILHSKISDDLRDRPILAIDDPRIGVTIVASKQYQQGSGREEGTSSVTPLTQCSRITYLHEGIYLVIMGDPSEFAYPIACEDTVISPRVALEEFIFHHIMRYNGELPPSDDIAEIVRDCIEKKVDEGFAGMLRPRYCEALLIVNPAAKSRSIREDSVRAAMYRVAHDRTGDHVVTNKMLPLDNGVCYFASQAQMWEDYKAKLALLRRKKNASVPKKGHKSKGASAEMKLPRPLENLNPLLCEHLIATVAALSLHEQDKEFNPAGIDLVTVPFVPPRGQKARDRYCLECLRPLYEIAKALDQ